ncbi:MAG TPA: hypothetical protein VG371_07545 [Solirubrobacteraceae bacterium]|nr:hypothetical protein [Solirubrobacteraceae bacterium]
MPIDTPDDLYGLPLERFIPERAALAKALRGEKRPEEASEVAARRKPSVAAWAVNQLLRTQPKGLKALFQAGDDLARAQADAEAGKRSGDAMRDAARRQRHAVGQLLEAAEGLLSSEGQALSQTTLERVGDTLRAAAVDEEARRQVEGGCLTHELRFVGLGIGGLSPAPAAGRPAGKAPTSAPAAAAPEKAPAGRKAKDKADEKKTGKGKADESKTAAARRAEEKAEAARRAEAEREAERERTAALKSARRGEAEARRAAARAEKELAAAQARRTDAAASLEEAERLLTAAEQRAEETATELDSAERALRHLTEA